MVTTQAAFATNRESERITVTLAKHFTGEEVNLKSNFIATYKRTPGEKTFAFRSARRDTTAQTAIPEKAWNSLAGDYYTGMTNEELLELLRK